MVYTDSSLIRLNEIQQFLKASTGIDLTLNQIDRQFYYTHIYLRIMSVPRFNNDLGILLVKDFGLLLTSREWPSFVHSRNTVYFRDCCYAEQFFSLFRREASQAGYHVNPEGGLYMPAPGNCVGIDNMDAAPHVSAPDSVFKKRL